MEWINSFYEVVLGPEKQGGYFRYMYWVDGTLFTLKLTLFAAVLGILIGGVIALLKLSSCTPFKGAKSKKLAAFNPLRFIGTLYTDIIRGTPAMIQLLFIYLVVLKAPGISKLTVAAVAFGLNSGAYVAEIIRAGIQGVDKGQMEAARSIGMSYPKAMLLIIIPQAVKNILPTLVSEFIVLLKETAIVGYIGGVDITKAANTIISQTYSAKQPLLMAAAIYLALTTIFTGIMRKFERRLRQSDCR